MKHKIVCFESVKPVRFTVLGEHELNAFSKKNEKALAGFADDMFGKDNWYWQVSWTLGSGYIAEKITGRCIGFSAEFESFAAWEKENKVPNKDDVKEAIETIIKFGRTKFKEDAQVTHARCFGMGFSTEHYDDISFLIEAASAHAEDWNHHRLARDLKEMARRS